MVSSSKAMLTVVWNAEGLHVFGVVPKGAASDVDYDCDHILSEILTVRPIRSNRRFRSCRQFEAAHLEANKRIHEQKQSKKSDVSSVRP
jgi:hypothetical protein